MISSSQRPLPDNTQHSQQAEICDPGGIQIHNPCRRAAADLRFRPRGHWDRPLLCRISSTVYHIHKWLASGGRQGSISGQSREVDRVVLGRLSLLVFQISPVSILPFSIPLSVSFHPAFPCQYSSTQQSPVSVPLPIIPMAVSFYPAFPFQYPSIQHSLVSILVPSIPLSVSFYTAFACQYPSYHKDKWVQHWDLQKAIPFQKHRMAGQKTSSTSVASFLHTNCSTSFLFITEAAHLPPLHPLHFPTLYPISNLLLP